MFFTFLGLLGHIGARVVRSFSRHSLVLVVCVCGKGLTTKNVRGWVSPPLAGLGGRVLIQGPVLKKMAVGEGSRSPVPPPPTPRHDLPDWVGIRDGWSQKKGGLRLLGVNKGDLRGRQGAASVESGRPRFLHMPLSGFLPIPCFQKKVVAVYNPIILRLSPLFSTCKSLSPVFSLDGVSPLSKESYFKSYPLSSLAVRASQCGIAVRGLD